MVDDKFAPVIERVYERARAWKEAGKPYPPYLEKQVKAVQLMVMNFDRGMLMLLDGMQDEEEYLKSIRHDALEEWGKEKENG